MKEEAPHGNPFIGEPRGSGRPRMVAVQLAHVASAPKLCPKGVVVELKREIVEWRGGRRWSTGHAWPPLNPYFHPTLHLAPIMLTLLTKSINRKANSFHPFPKFFLFIYF
jgi:hypothetical protein